MEFDKAVAELDLLVSTLEAEGDERSLLLLQLIDAIHRPALARIAAGDLDDPMARALLAMYDLIPPDDELLVEEALDEVRPYVHSHGGEVELLSVDDGLVRLRMSGACSGCAASAMTLKRGIETALREHYPGFREVQAEEADPGPQLLQIENLRRPEFAQVDPADAPGRGKLSATEVGGVNVLMANLDGEVFAFRNGCAVDGMTLEGGRLTTGGVLVCPWHNCAYDARSGSRIDEPEEEGLVVVPIAVRDGELQVAVNVP